MEENTESCQQTAKVLPSYINFNEEDLDKCINYVTDNCFYRNIECPTTEKTENMELVSLDTEATSSTVNLLGKSQTLVDPVARIFEFIKYHRNQSSKLQEKCVTKLNNINNFNSRRSLSNSNHFKHKNVKCEKSGNKRKRTRSSYDAREKITSLKSVPSYRHSQNNPGHRQTYSEPTNIESNINCNDHIFHRKSDTSRQYENFHVTVSPQHEDDSANVPRRILTPLRQFFSKEQQAETRISENVVTPKDVYFHIIQWKTTWLKAQKKTNKCPVIFRLEQTKECYRSFTEFLDTYYGLNLLTTWLNLYESWINPTTSFYASLEHYEEQKYYVENECHVILSSGNLPKYHDVILLSYHTVQGTKNYLFGFIYSVVTENVLAPLSRLGGWKKVKFCFYTREKIMKNIGARVKIHALCNIKVGLKQCLALQSLKSSSMRRVIIDPKTYAKEIEIVSLTYLCPLGQLQTQARNIIDCAMSPNNRFTLVVQPENEDNVLAILKLVRNLLIRRCTILVCLRSAMKCFKIAERLQSNFILAVKEKEVVIPQNLKKYTLSHLAHSMCEQKQDVAKLEILKKSNIILTVMSCSFFTDNNKSSFDSNLTCIIDEAHLCTEAETALPLSYEPKTMVLLGNPKTTLELHPFLQSRGYHYSLFHRLYKGKNKTKTTVKYQ